MPNYTFQCNLCQSFTEKNISISEFLLLKKQKLKCENCNDGVLSQKILLINSSVEYNKDQVLMDSKEEIQKIVEKVKSGDLRSITDIYGDKPNSYKKEPSK